MLKNVLPSTRNIRDLPADKLTNRAATAEEVSLNCDVTEAFAEREMARIGSPNWREKLPPVRQYHVGASDYSKYKIQPWDIWLEYNLNPWDADIIKRVLRSKTGQRRLDYEKIKHVCDERIRQLDEALNSTMNSKGEIHASLGKEKGTDIKAA